MEVRSGGSFITNPPTLDLAYFKKQVIYLSFFCTFTINSYLVLNLHPRFVYTLLSFSFTNGSSQKLTIQSRKLSRSLVLGL